MVRQGEWRASFQKIKSSLIELFKIHTFYRKKLTKRTEVITRRLGLDIIFQFLPKWIFLRFLSGKKKDYIQEKIPKLYNQIQKKVEIWHQQFEDRMEIFKFDVKLIVEESIQELEGDEKVFENYINIWAELLMVLNDILKLKKGRSLVFRDSDYCDHAFREYLQNMVREFLKELGKKCCQDERLKNNLEEARDLVREQVLKYLLSSKEGQKPRIESICGQLSEEELAEILED